MEVLRVVLVHDIARALLVAAVAFVLTLFVGRWWVHFARRNNIGKRIRNDGPQSHMTKMGTPTMGGVMIVITVVIVTMLFNMVDRWSMLLPLAVLSPCSPSTGCCCLWWASSFWLKLFR